MAVGTMLWLQTGAAGVSACMLVWWVLVTFKYQRNEATPLHHFLTVSLAFRLLNDLALTTVFALMQAEASITQATLLVSMTSTLYRTFLYISLLLLSKGFATIRHTITKTELTGFTLASGLLYVFLSLYMLRPKSLLFIYLLVLVLVLFYCSRFLSSTLKVITHQIELYGRMQLSELVVSSSLKLELVKSFQVLCSLYFLLEIGCVTLLQANQGHGFTLQTAHIFLEILLLGLIYYSFRARPYSRLFHINDVESASEEEDWQPPVLFTPRCAQVPLLPNCPVLVQLPGKEAWVDRCEIGLLEDTD